MLLKRIGAVVAAGLFLAVLFAGTFTVYAQQEPTRQIAVVYDDSGSMIFDDGPLTLAMKIGGIFLFNEADLCSPATLAGLNTILDGSPLCIAENGGELVKPSPMFRFIRRRTCRKP